MRIIKKLLIIIFMLTTVGFLFRGWLYRHLVRYESVGLRTNYWATGNALTDYIDAGIDIRPDPDIKQVIKLGLSLTSGRLNFTADKNEIDPNKLITSRTAHCVGYAAFFASTCNYLLKKYNLSDTWTAKPQIGQLYFLGANVHQNFRSSFFKDHDFVIIENKTTGTIYAVDPTINDYLRIDFVTFTQ